jgi:predicted transcriptional regulator
MGRRATARFGHIRLAALGIGAVLLMLAPAALGDLDTSPPALQVFSPADGALLPDDRAIVFGATERGAVVTVNGVAADVNVFDGTFEVRDLSMAPTGTGCRQGASITVTARDGAGNLATVTRGVSANHCVTHPTLAAPVPDLTLTSGQTTALAIDLSDYFADDGGAQQLTFSTYMTGPAAASMSATYGPGALSFSWASPSFAGEATLTVIARDRSGEVSDPALVAVHVSAAPSPNHAPVVQVPSALDALPIGGAVRVEFVATDADSDPITLSASAEGAGLRVSPVELVDATHFAVTVTAGPDALAGAPSRVIVTAVDSHFAGASGVLSFSVYDASRPAGLSVQFPAVPEVLATQFVAGPHGGAGIFLELGAARRVPHLYLADPRSDVAAGEVSALNAEQTYFRLFVALPSTPGVYTQTVWAVDPGFAPEPFSFAVTVLAAPLAPRIDQLTPVSGDLSLAAGEPLVLQWVGAVPDPAHTTFEWAVDGAVVARTSRLSGATLDVGTHAVTLTATAPSGASSASTAVTVAPRAAPALAQRSTPWYLWAGLGGIVVVGIILGGTEVGIYFLLAGLVGAIIDRENREKLLTHFVRGRIYQIIEYEPGVHLSELQRKAGVARGVCAYHLHALEKAGLVKTARDGMYLRFFATKVKIDAEVYDLAADDREVLRAVEARPGITEREVSELLGKNAVQVARCVKALSQSGHVEARREGEAVQLYPRTNRGTASVQPGEL